MNLVVPEIDELVAITILARWTGFAVPSLRCNRSIVRRVSATTFESSDEMNEATCPLSFADVQRFLAAIRPISERPDECLFHRPQEELDYHFSGFVTDDYPEFRVTLDVTDGSRLQLSTTSNHAHLLPWKIASEMEFVSYHPELSVSLGRLLPEGFLLRGRLVDSSAAFHADGLLRAEVKRQERQRHTETDPVSDKAPQNGYSAKQLLQMKEEQLLELISTGYDLSTSDSTGQTALMLAAFPPFNQEQFWKLVRVGADVNARRRDGLTGLMLACAGSMEKEVREWLLAGADVHVKGPNGCTALMLGAKNGNIVADLLEYGARANDKDNDGDSALDYALVDPSIMWAGRRLRSIELLATRLAESSPDSLARSYEQSKTTARQFKLETEINRLFHGKTLSEKIRGVKELKSPNAHQTAFFNDAYQFIDLEITEIELIDQMVEILDKRLRSLPPQSN